MARSNKDKLETLESVSEVLARTSIALDPKRCSYIRNWNSTCRMCLNVCQHDAISRSIGRLHIDSEACTECGACVAACPTSTFSATSPTMNQIVALARENAEKLDQHVVFACSHHVERLGIDTGHVVELPCLNYLDEYTITGLFALDVKMVVLFKPGCEGCSIDCAEPYIDTVIASTKALLKQWQTHKRLKVYDEVPSAFLIEAQSGKKHRREADASQRREAFADAGLSMQSYLYSAIGDTVGSLTGAPPKKKEDKDPQIIVRLDEVYPADSYRGVRMLRMLDFLGTRPYGQHVQSRFWTNVNIDPERCRHCGACATMCVTRALVYTEHDDKTVSLTFQPSLCVGCRLCKDGCLTRSMKYENDVLADDLDEDVVKHLLDHAEPDKRKKYF